MSFRTKSWLGLAVLLPVFVYVWVGPVGDWLSRTKPAGVLTVLILFSVLAAFNVVWFAYTYTFIKCPNCGIGFGPKMYKTGIFTHPWPRRYCWNCKADMNAAGAAKAPKSI
jgi:hypothetical protein